MPWLIWQSTYIPFLSCRQHMDKLVKMVGALDPYLRHKAISKDGTREILRAWGYQEYLQTWETQQSKLGRQQSKGRLYPADNILSFFL